LIEFTFLRVNKKTYSNSVNSDMVCIISLPLSPDPLRNFFLGGIYLSIKQKKYIVAIYTAKKAIL
ncbi:MAG: hypothetical protein AB1589_04875, partial [Cyanobacteriota bacterium]